jgi:hypothetical protein
VLDSVGHRSFGPLLLLAGLVLVTPGIGDIPGVTTTTGIFIALVAGQMLIRRNYLWLPQWILKRKIKDETLCKAIGWLRKPAGYVDRVIKPRLTGLTYNIGRYGIALACFGIAMATPAMEVVLGSANVAGVAFSAFGLSLIAHDGLLASIAYAFTLGRCGGPIVRAGLAAPSRTRALDLQSRPLLALAGHERVQPLRPLCANSGHRPIYSIIAVKRGRRV